MKNHVVRRLKKVIAVALTVSMLAGMSMIASARTVDETDLGDGQIVYTQMDDYAEYLGQNKAPANVDQGSGKLFAGWFAKVDDTYKPLKNSSDIPENNDGIYAIYIPAQLLSVKCQNATGTAAGMSGTTKLKVLTGVDSLNYQKIGFDISVIALSEDGKTWTNKEIKLNSMEDTVVYRNLKVNGTPYTASDAFCIDGATYFATGWVTGIGSAYFDSIICIKPYLVTLDGVTVEGLTKYAHVEDGLAYDGDVNYRWVNIPVNVRAKDNQGVAAGVLKLAGTAGWECVGIECGRVFQEMDYAVVDSKDVKIVGNLSSMDEDAKVNDILVNVRFKVPSSSLQTGNTQYECAISGVDFANIAETAFGDNTGESPVWDVVFSVMRTN